MSHLRTALCITGLPRTMEYCYPSQKQHLLDVYKPDVFTCVTSEHLGRVMDLYAPKETCLCSEEAILEEASYMRKGLTPISYPPSALPFSYKMLRCVDMVLGTEQLSNFKYDVVFLSRFDVKFKSIQEVHKSQPNTLYVPRIGAYWDTPPDAPGIHWGGYSGHLCWTTSAVAEELANLYYAPEDWHGRSLNSGSPFGNAAEHLMKFYCDQTGIQVEFVDIEMMLIRGTDSEPKAYNHTDLSNFPGY